VKEPLLLIEGEADGGETPFGARALFDALRGLGGSVRLVLLPREHGRLRARESVLHTAWEMERWLETRVTEAGASPAKDGGPE
jgi:dipeptidyl aminopeptidase/acylaminoacyl peptidase